MNKKNPNGGEFLGCRRIRSKEGNAKVIIYDHGQAFIVLKAEPYFKEERRT